MTTVAVLDYECGNVRSITNALIRIGVVPVLTREPSSIQASDALIIPGVGAFANAMDLLKKYRLPEEIYRFADSGKCILGICLGMQMLFDQSEEFGVTSGLGLIKGVVKKLPVRVDGKIRLPHIAWNGIYPSSNTDWEEGILSCTQPYSKVYFVHSYAAMPENRRSILSLTAYGDCEFVSSVRSGCMFGCQFHPEKSGVVGLTILEQFVGLSKDIRNGRDITGRTASHGSLLRVAAAGSIL